MALLDDAIESGLLRADETQSFVDTLAATYKPNPYHNAAHGADVANSFLTLISGCRRLRKATLGPPQKPFAEELNHTACVVAALGHDVGHPGFNNVFLENTCDPLAVTYND